MPRHRLVTGPFSALEGALFGAIEALQADDPLARVDVVVPTNLLGLDLRRRYADWRAAREPGRGHANLRFPTFFDLARETAGDVPGRAAPSSLLFAAVASAISRVPEADRFGPVRHRVGFARAVEATLRDLRDAGVPPEEFRSWACDGPPGVDARRGLLEALGALYADVAAQLEGFADDAATFRAAVSKAGAAASAAPLLLHGFYDFTGLQRDVLSALAAARPLFVFLPRYGGDLGDFALAAEKFLGELLGCAPEAAPSAASATADARAVFLQRFTAREAGSELIEDGSLALVSAADDASEAREAAREILIGRGQGQSLARTAILLRQESDAARFDAALNRAGIPHFRRPADAWSDTPAGRALVLWLRLEEDGFRRDDVLDVLELSTVSSPDPYAPHFRGLARQCGVLRGLEAWDAAVKRLAAASSEPEDEDSRSRFASRLPGGREAARRLKERWEALRDSASGWPAGPLTFAGWAEEAQRRIERLFAPAEVPEPAAAALDALAALSEGGGEVSREVAFEVFLSGLAARAQEPGRLGRDGVAILTVMEARGLAFDHVIVPGLVEKSFPARARPDPLLFDDERVSLALRTGRPLAPRTLHRPAEERLLFAIAADAARKRLVLTASRRDSALDRERTPSQFFTRAEDAAAAGHVRRTLLGHTTALGPAVSLSEARHRALDTDGAEALAGIFPPLEAALARRAAREEPFGPFEGLLRSPDLSAMLAPHVPGPSRSVSPSAVEMFSKCAYQYYFRHVVRMRPIEETEEPADLGPLELGKLVHDSARRAALSPRGQQFGELTSDRALAHLAASSSAEALAAFEEANGIVLSPPLMREIALGRVRNHVQAWLTFERRAPRGVFAPAGAEVRFGPATGPDRAADPELSSDEPALSTRGAPLHGQIDLISVDAAAGVTRVTDFKVKMSKKAVEAIARQRREGAVVWSGEMLQLPVYALAAAGPIGRRGGLPADISSEYLFLAADPELDSPSVRVESVGLDAAATRDAVSKLELILETMRASVSEGIFRPRPAGTLRKEQCLLCDFASICGPDHQRLFERKAESPEKAVGLLDALSQIP